MDWLSQRTTLLMVFLFVASLSYAQELATQTKSLSPVEYEELEIEGVRFDSSQSRAVFIGINEFDDPAIAALRFAVDDAIDLAHRLWELRLVDPSGIELALSGEPSKPETLARLDELKEAGVREPRRATRSSILQALLDAGNGAGANGMLIVFASTHGYYDQIDAILTRDSNLNLQLDTGILRDTSLSHTRLVSLVQRSECPRKLVLLDVCRERLTKTSSVSGLSPISEEAMETLASARGMAVLTATTTGGFGFDGGVSLANTPIHNGIFTHFILDALTNGVEDESKIYVTLGDVAETVDERMRQWTKQRWKEERGIGRDKLEDDWRFLPVAINPRALESSLNWETRIGGAIYALRKRIDRDILTHALASEIEEVLLSLDQDSNLDLLKRIDRLDQDSLYTSDFVAWWLHFGRPEYGVSTVDERREVVDSTSATAAPSPAPPVKDTQERYFELRAELDQLSWESFSLAPAAAQSQFQSFVIRYSAMGDHELSEQEKSLLDLHCKMRLSLLLFFLGEYRQSNAYLLEILEHTKSVAAGKYEHDFLLLRIQALNNLLANTEIEEEEKRYTTEFLEISERLVTTHPNVPDVLCWRGVSLKNAAYLYLFSVDATESSYGISLLRQADSILKRAFDLDRESLGIRRNWSGVKCVLGEQLSTRAGFEVEGKQLIDKGLEMKGFLRQQYPENRLFASDYGQFLCTRAGIETTLFARGEGSLTKARQWYREGVDVLSQVGSDGTFPFFTSRYFQKTESYATFEASEKVDPTTQISDSDILKAHLLRNEAIMQARQLTDSTRSVWDVSYYLSMLMHQDALYLDGNGKTEDAHRQYRQAVETAKPAIALVHGDATISIMQGVRGFLQANSRMLLDYVTFLESQLESEGISDSKRFQLERERKAAFEIAESLYMKSRTAEERDNLSNLMFSFGKLKDSEFDNDRAKEIYQLVIDKSLPDLEREPWRFFLRSRLTGTYGKLADLNKRMGNHLGECEARLGWLRHWGVPYYRLSSELLQKTPEECTQEDLEKLRELKDSISLKRYTIPCLFGGLKYDYQFYITNHVQSFYDQVTYLEREKGGQVPPEVVDSFKRLWVIARENNVSYQDLVQYALSNEDTGYSTSADSSGEATPTPVATNNANQDTREANDGKSTEYTDTDNRVIALVFGTLDAGGPYWCYVAVKPSKYAEFRVAHEAGEINLFKFEEYGEIVVAGEGEKPSTEMTVKVAEMYGLDPNNMFKDVDLSGLENQ